MEFSRVEAGRNQVEYTKHSSSYVELNLSVLNRLSPVEIFQLTNNAAEVFETGRPESNRHELVIRAVMEIASTKLKSSRM